MVMMWTYPWYYCLFLQFLKILFIYFNFKKCNCLSFLRQTGQSLRSLKGSEWTFESPVSPQPTSLRPPLPPAVALGSCLSSLLQCQRAASAQSLTTFTEASGALCCSSWGEASSLCHRHALQQEPEAGQVLRASCTQSPREGEPLQHPEGQPCPSPLLSHPGLRVSLTRT